MFLKNFEKISDQKLPKKFSSISINPADFDDTALAVILNGAKVEYMCRDGYVLPCLTEQTDYEKLDNKYFSSNFSKKLIEILLYSKQDKKDIARKIITDYFEIVGEIAENPFDTFSLSSVMEEEPAINFNLYMKKRIPYLLYLSITKAKYDVSDIPLLKDNLNKYGYEDIEKDMIKLIQK